jgi:hypothetical protein
MPVIKSIINFFIKLDIAKLISYPLMPIVYKPSEKFDKRTRIHFGKTKQAYVVLMALDNKLRKKIINLIHKHKNTFHFRNCMVFVLRGCAGVDAIA